VPKRKTTDETFDPYELLPTCEYTVGSWGYKDDAAHELRNHCESLGLTSDLAGLREHGPMWVMARLGQQHNLHVYEPRSFAGGSDYCLVVARCVLTHRQLAAIVACHHGDSDPSWVLEEPDELADDLATHPDDVRENGWSGLSSDSDASRTSPSTTSSISDDLATLSHVVNERAGRTYRVVTLLGQGGFGTAYEAAVEEGTLARAGDARLCLKVSTHVESWHREAYFGQVLEGIPRAIQIFDSFAFVPDESKAPLYCLVSELAEFGSLESYFETHPRGWTEVRAKREVVALLRLVVLLHTGGAVHRDLTPNNVLVTKGGHLALADFGIALHGRGRGVRGRTMNYFFAPSSLRRTTGRVHWTPADDVYQIGQILARVLVGGFRQRFDTRDVAELRCSDQLKGIIQRAIGERRKRWSDAEALLHALEADPPVVRASRLKSLKGLRLVFTGRLSINRAEAARLARRAGARVQAKVGGATDVVVQGKASEQWMARAKGQKLLDADRERERGHLVATLSERRFLRLVTPIDRESVVKTRAK
jgi:hypothetical protein